MGERRTPRTRRLTAAVIVLALGSGAVDAFSFVALGAVFASVMTGNLVLLGIAVVHAHLGPALSAGFAITAYVIGVYATATWLRRARPAAPGASTLRPPDSTRPSLGRRRDGPIRRGPRRRRPDRRVRGGILRRTGPGRLTGKTRRWRPDRGVREDGLLRGTGPGRFRGKTRRPRRPDRSGREGLPRRTGPGRLGGNSRRRVRHRAHPGRVDGTYRGLSRRRRPGARDGVRGGRPYRSRTRRGLPRRPGSARLSRARPVGRPAYRGRFGRTGSALRGRASRDIGLKGGVRPGRVQATLRVVPVTQAAVLAGWLLCGTHPGGVARLGLLALSAFAMGVQSAGVNTLPLSGAATTYLTGTLTTLTTELATSGVPATMRRRFAVLAAALAGAGMDAVLLTWARPAAPALPLAATLTVALMLARLR